ncbi:MAG: 16S rRNA (guanine(966)-N(2))-methyltransferase RsmD [bacterium]|nr:16S rRNA (guanine(966)-N(2))-methyltransferase RsmD [bacterium]
MRITGGKWRSRRIDGPGSRSPVRPTPDSLRERAFAVLGSAVEDAAVLDLFAGTGSVGLEAISRGAARVIFVEQHRGTARLIVRNCESFGLERETSRVMVKPSAKAVVELSRAGEQFDLAWADPPFENWLLGLAALMTAAAEGIIRPNGICCLECPDRAELPEDIGLLRVDRFLDGGASRLVIMGVDADEP